MRKLCISIEVSSAAGREVKPAAVFSELLFVMKAGKTLCPACVLHKDVIERMCSATIVGPRSAINFVDGVYNTQGCRFI